MNTRNIQAFLMVSAAFFAMSAPARSNSASAGEPSSAVTRGTEVAPARVAVDRVARSIQFGDENQNS